MNRKLHRELIKEASKFHWHHSWIDIDDKPKKITLKDTTWGRLTAKLKRRRCMKCGKEEYIEINGGYAHKFDRKWEAKPTTEDTVQELFGIPPHSNSENCECGCQDGSIDDDSGIPPRPDVPPAPPSN
jgi:hypothetical protein